MGYRFRGFIRAIGRLVLVILGMAVVWAGWRAFLHFGPGRGDTKPALYPFHAKALVWQRLGFPRPAPRLTLPVPQTMSSADVQLRLMKWWDGKHWLPDALARGIAGKNALELNAGELSLAGITEVGPARTEEGQTICAVQFQARWDAPKDLQEILRVKDIVNLRQPKGPGPGQLVAMTCTFRQDGWRWVPISSQSPWAGKMEFSTSRAWMEWLF